MESAPVGGDQDAGQCQLFLEPQNPEKSTWDAKKERNPCVGFRLSQYGKSTAPAGGRHAGNLQSSGQGDSDMAAQAGTVPVGAG